MMKTKPAGTERQREHNRRALLAEIRNEALNSPWSPVASEIVDIIDDGGYCA